MVCPACNTQIGLYEKVCRDCGIPIVHQKNSPPNMSYQNRGSPYSTSSELGEMQVQPPSNLFHGNGIGWWLQLVFLGIVIIFVSVPLLGQVITILTDWDCSWNFPFGGRFFDPFRSALTAGILLTIELIALQLFNHLWRRYEPSKKQGIQGEVRGLHARGEEGLHLALGPLHFANTRTVWDFTVNWTDSARQRYQVPVVLSGHFLDGVLKDNHEVYLPGTWRPGQTMRLHKLYNVTTGGYVQVGNRIGIGAILIPVIAAYIFIQALMVVQMLRCF